MTIDYDALSLWINRAPHPDVEKGTVVRCTAPELYGITGIVKWSTVNGDQWAIAVPYGEDGALIYVHKADVEPAPVERQWFVPKDPGLSVLAVRDRYRFRWLREGLSTSWAPERGGDPVYSWEVLLSKRGPLTDATGDVSETEAS